MIDDSDLDDDCPVSDLYCVLCHMWALRGCSTCDRCHGQLFHKPHPTLKDKPNA